MPEPVQHSRLKVRRKGNTSGRLGIRERVENRRNGEGKSRTLKPSQKGREKASDPARSWRREKTVLNCFGL